MPKKKVKPIDNIQEQEQKEIEELENVKAQFSEIDVNYVNNFAQELMGMMHSPLTYHPMLQNQVTKDLNMNPMFKDYETVQKLIQNPKMNEKVLRQLSQYLYNVMMPIKRLIKYYSTILTWDYMIIPQVEEKELTTPSFIKYENKVYDFMESFNIKKMFLEMMEGAMLEDTKFYYLRESENGYTFQELPSDYCMIVSKNEVSYEFAFDMSYFFRAGTRLDLYPPEFTDYYMEMLNYDKSKGDRRTNNAIIETKNGRWFYWRKLDSTKAFTFKFNNLFAGLTPPMLGLFLDTINIAQSKDLQKTQSQLDAYNLLIATIPRNKDNRSGNKADDFAISASTVAKFAAMIKSNMQDGVDFKVMPFDEVKSFTFDKGNSNKNLAETALDNFYKSTGSSQTTTLNDKPNQSTTLNAQKVDEAFVTHMYSIAEGIMGLVIKKHISSKYKFDIKFTGTIFDKKERIENAHKMASIGIVSMDLLASSIGLNARQLQRLVASSNAKGYPEKLKPIQSAFQTSTKDLEESKVGREKKNIDELDDSGMATRDNQATE